MNHAPRCCLVLLVLNLFALAAWADCNPKDPDICAAGSPWYSANSIQLVVGQPSVADRTSFSLTIPDPLNLVIDLDNVFQGKPQKGTIKLVEGRAMLTHGLSLEKGYEIDALDGPILTYQILVSLLSQAIPAGPGTFSGTKTISLEEQKRGIRIATMSASGYLRAPWMLAGTVSRKDAETVTFSLKFTYTKGTNPSVLSFDGSWKKLQQAPQIDSAMLLQGWRLHLLGPVEIKQEGSTIFDYAAQSQPTPVGTLGELRKAIMSEKEGSSPVRQGAPASGRP